MGRAAFEQCLVLTYCANEGRGAKVSVGALQRGDEASLRGSSGSNTFSTLSSQMGSHVQAGVERDRDFMGAVKWAGSQFKCQGNKSGQGAVFEIDMEVATAAKRRMRSMARHSRSQ